MRLDSTRHKHTNTTFPTNKWDDSFDLTCPECKMSRWSFYVVTNRSRSPLSHIGMKCNACGKLIIVPTISFTLEYLGREYWSN